MKNFTNVLDDKPADHLLEIDKVQANEFSIISRVFDIGRSFMGGVENKNYEVI